MKLRGYLENRTNPRQSWSTVAALLEERGSMTPKEITEITGWTITKTRSILQRMKYAGYTVPQKGWKIIKRLD